MDMKGSSVDNPLVIEVSQQVFVRNDVYSNDQHYTSYRVISGAAMLCASKRVIVAAEGHCCSPAGLISSSAYLYTCL
jgi:hypothetical protein